MAEKQVSFLNNAIDEAIKIINAMKSEPLRTHLFHILCASAGSRHDTLMPHTGQQRLSQGVEASPEHSELSLFNNLLTLFC